MYTSGIRIDGKYVNNHQWVVIVVQQLTGVLEQNLMTFYYHVYYQVCSTTRNEEVCSQ